MKAQEGITQEGHGEHREPSFVSPAADGEVEKRLRIINTFTPRKVTL